MYLNVSNINITAGVTHYGPFVKRYSFVCIIFNEIPLHLPEDLLLRTP